VFSPDVHQRIRYLYALLQDNLQYDNLGQVFADKLQYHIHDVVDHLRAERPKFDEPDLDVVWEPKGYTKKQGK